MRLQQITICIRVGLDGLQPDRTVGKLERGSNEVALERPVWDKGNRLGLRTWG